MSASARHRVETRAPRGEVRPDLVDVRDETRHRFLEDAAHYPGGEVRGVAFPQTEAEVAALCTLGVPLLPIGAQSSLTGGATPRGEIVVCTSHLVDIALLDNGLVRAGAGVTLDRLQDALSGRGLWYPPVPTYTSCTCGGVVATNAAGPATFKYGTTRAWVAGLTTILPDGRVLDLVRDQAVAHPDGYFEIVSGDRAIRVPVPRVARPSVPKCSAGYFGAAGMDLVDLFIGAEGTLGITTAVAFRTAPTPAATLAAMVTAPSAESALTLVTRLRDASEATRRTRDPFGIDAVAIEMIDARSIALLREDAADTRLGVSLAPAARIVLFVELESNSPLSDEDAWRQAEGALTGGDADGPVARLCRLLADADLLDATELALPGQVARRERFRQLREAVPDAVNRRVALAKVTDDRISKTAADIVVPFARFAELMTACDHAFVSRGLDYAVWGHVSDGNVHPNAIPRSFDDVARGREAVMAIGEAAIALGGAPLAEHGVGRNAIKKALLRQLHGDAGIASMQAVKRALDPNGLLAPGVLL